MATVTIADKAHPKHLVNQTRPVDDGVDLIRTATGRSQDDGIYNIRSRTRSHPVNPGFDRTSFTPGKDEDPGIRKDGDLKTAQVFSGKMLFWLAYQSVGVIYGDIGTSPLYVFSSTFTEAPNKEDLIGVLSLILWSLIMMVTVKYVLIVLHADNDGEGGTFSTYALLSRYTNITNRDPREASLVRMGRWASGDLESAGRKMRKGLESSKIVRGLLKIMGVLAVSMVISDGVLTPAQSVLGAVQGAEVVNPSLSRSAIIGITDAILVVLFAVQPLGISKITILFAPVIIIWLAFNAVFGAYNLAKYDASVFKAFNPGYGFLYLIHHKEEGWRRLGGVLLCFTGVEALFADLGAFSRRAIQLSWLCYVFPCLILAYVGQAAYISVHPEAYSNPFFNAAPPGTIYPALIIAILAAVVASQAIITATFQLLAQVMKLSYFPQLKVVHTSKIFHGQLYVPLANWLLMIGTILIASVYNNTTSLGNAYGVCVIFVTFFDTIMCTLVAIFVWRYSPLLVAVPFLTIICMDGTFLSSALTKVPDGAWFTLTLAAVLASVFLVWRYGKEQQWFAEAEDRFPTSHFIRHNTLGELSLTDRFNGTPMSQIKGFGMFFDKAGETTPIVFSNFAIKMTAAPEIMVFFHLRPLETPSVPQEERHTVSRLAIPNCYRLVVRYGYNDEVITPNLAAVVHEQVKLYLMNARAIGAQRKRSVVRPIYSPDEKADVPMNNMDLDDEEEEAWHHKLHDERLSDELARLDRAFDHKLLYIIGKEQMRIRKGTNWVRRVLLETFLWMRDNTRGKMANLNVPKDKIIEVGFLKDI
ncbi:hypothetical protein H2198_003391 [Neophaeococcomyces mojaviensis]|uniref:Uncharacterized protein n=1 Tax=Neophaeococcomyces mojaviensis TaxID=3383035 RepID=A0ACC3ABG0_9EURO|nr:hypothetical protein H2198_003391 [Knufia sp. JES_112]